MFNTDPRLKGSLPQPEVLRNKVVGITFVPPSADEAVFEAVVEADWTNLANMAVKLRPGKVRLQIAGFGGEREIIFENTAELMLVYQMMDRFITELPSVEDDR